MESIFKILEEESSIIRAKGFLNGTEGWRFVNYTLGSSSQEKCTVQPGNKLVVIAEKNETDSLQTLLQKMEVSQRS